MSKVIVYHGATVVVERPLCSFGRPNLDFGQGFYVTELRRQAVDWAVRLQIRRQAEPLLNRYLIDKEALYAEGRALVFSAYDEEWLRFIAACRDGFDAKAVYDVVEGGVADDRVIDTVKLYMQGLLPIEVALHRLAAHQPNNQICLLNQSLTDKYLVYDGTETI